VAGGERLFRAQDHSVSICRLQPRIFVDSVEIRAARTSQCRSPIPIDPNEIAKGLKVTLPKENSENQGRCGSPRAADGGDHQRRTASAPS
jgi:hypothetical protein